MAYQQRGARRDDLVAGLAFSIATNYLNRLVRERHIGDVIFFQGGTAYNDAVAAAFSQILEKDIIVPPHNGVMGALGMALLARERVSRTGEPTTFRGWDLEQVDYTVVDFVCKACSNECDVRQFTIEGEKTYWGDKCSDRYRKPAKVDKEPVIARPRRLPRGGSCWRPTRRRARALPESAPTVGFARAMYTYDRLPFWATFFAELGFAAGALAGERQADPRGRRGAHRGRAVLPHPRGARPRAVAVQRGRGLGVPAQPGQRRDRVHAVQLARLPVGPDAALRRQARPRARAAQGQDPRPARALPRRARGPGARLRRHDADARP